MALIDRGLRRALKPVVWVIVPAARFSVWMAPWSANPEGDGMAAYVVEVDPSKPFAPLVRPAVS